MSTVNGGLNQEQQQTSSEVSLLAALNSVLPSQKGFLRKVGKAEFVQVQPRIALRMRISSQEPVINADASEADIFDITLKNDISVNPPKNGVDGQTIRFCFRQDEVGKKKVKWDGFVDPVIPVPTTAKTCTYVTFFFDGVLHRWVYQDGFTVSNSS